MRFDDATRRRASVLRSAGTGYVPPQRINQTPGVARRHPTERYDAP